MKPYLVFSTVGSPKEGKKIASVLVREKLAACVNVIPGVFSVFKWRGKMDHARELLLIVKTDVRHLKKIEQTIRKHHSYQVPEIIGWPLAWGHQPYLDWLRDSVRLS
ncbi:MAG: divalent-cation tolerance protein CutA [Candidatus Omnitrophica bacterium]|nr:divalent-cation tolerance protein CutA [Candidatus Omnitrophota bacterium]